MPDSRAHIRIWSAMSLETKIVLGLGELERGITAVAFSTMNKGVIISLFEGYDLIC